MPKILLYGNQLSRTEDFISEYSSGQGVMLRVSLTQI